MSDTTTPALPALSVPLMSVAPSSAGWIWAAVTVVSAASSRTTSTFIFLPFRMMLISTSAPAPMLAIRARSSWKLFNCRPLIAVMISPAWRPPFSAAESGWTSLTNAPVLTSAFIASASPASISLPSMPNSPRRTSPYSAIWSTRFFIILAGMAKPMPTLPPFGPNIAVLIPTNSPWRFTNAPPEFPRLIAASVWMKSSYPPMFKPERPSALTMPDVTVWDNPNGFPIATTKSPTRSASESASGNAFKSSGSILSKAISLCSSEPNFFALNSRPSVSLTVISSALSTTWLLVTTYPLSASIITPEPKPLKGRSWTCSCGAPKK